MLSQALNSQISESLARLVRPDGQPVEWVVAPGYVPYDEAVAEMEARVTAIHAGEAAERVWLLEHPTLYTAGVSARDEDLLDAGRFPVHRTGRGGQFTYHGPGQRVAYVMLDLNQRGRDVRAFVRGLEQWLIGALGQFGVEGEVKDGRVGVWVERPTLPAVAGADISSGPRSKGSAFSTRRGPGASRRLCALGISRTKKRPARGPGALRSVSVATSGRG